MLHPLPFLLPPTPLPSWSRPSCHLTLALSLPHTWRRRCCSGQLVILTQPLRELQLAGKRAGSWQGPPPLHANRLLSEAADDTERARLLAVAAPESGAWLRALPVSALGLRMDDDTVRIAVGLRLGAPTCGPHQCRDCSVEVDVFGRHSLSCKKSEGRHFRHSALNDIVKRGLSAAHIPSGLEPTGLLRSDGERPDGVTLAPWSSGCLLVWDATCPDTFAISYRAQATSESGRVAESAERTGRQRSTVVSRRATVSPLLPSRLWER